MSKTKLNELVALLGGEQLQSLVETVSRQKDPLTEPAKTKKYRQLDIAIIGLSGRYPRADHHYEFWKKLQQGANFLQEVPVSRWNHGDYYDPHIKGSPVPGKTRCKFGAFLNAYDQFDASFFDLDIAEITIMDPQERLALETTWSCIEDAGYVPAALAKEVGIFSGVTYSEYQKLIHVPSHACMLNSRIAYFFNFQGPSVTTDAGCSSSLTAIHLACQSLTRKECRTAIVIGANLILHPGHYTGISSMLSPTNQPYSNPFGTDDGWIPAEGVVSILLKPLSRALQDRDHIYGVIKSSHIRQEGKTSWFTAFNPKQQARLIRENFEKSGIHPETISYVEAAANGSALGDAIELEGLTAAFGHFTAKKQFCPLGTVKSRVGHGEAASTLLQLTNVLLQFKSKTLFPLAHLKEKNPNIRIEDSPFYFQDSPQKWEPPYINLEGKRFTMPRRAAISSFATGGHMGHLILEEHVPVNRQKQTPDSYFIPISAKTAAQLRETVENFIKFFKEYPTLDSGWESDYTLLNIMYTLCVGRMPFRERVVFIVSGPETLRERFQQFINGESHPDIISNVEAGAGDTKAQSPRHPVQRCLENRSWHDLAQWWVRGAAVSWETFFQSYAVQRISLPTYCFQKQFFPIPRPARPDLAKDNTNPAVPVESEAPVDDVEIDTAVITRFEAVFAKAIPIPAGQIDLTLPLDQYGFDSVKVLRIAHELEAYFPRVPKTLFFECQTLGDVIDYFTREYPDEARQMLQNPFPAANIIKHPNKKFCGGPGALRRREPIDVCSDSISLSNPNMHLQPAPVTGETKEPPGRRRHTDIAIIGLAGRYPHAKNIQEFWQNLKAGKDAVSEIPPDRWNWRDYFHPHRQEAVKSGKSYSKWGGFIDDIDRFDPLFFNISPREAETMDPQERLFLEVAWEALEDAGYDRTGLKTNRPGKQHMKVGVFVGASWQEYQLFSGMGPGEDRTVFSTTANNIANRVSYFFDFKGTSLTVDTACSSSLTAIHLARGSLIQGLDTMAIAGGVNLSVHPNKYISLSGHQVLSGSGRCESFGKGGDGYVPGEGVGAVLLKPLSQAILDGDHIYGIIKAAASNHGGKTNGYTVPDPNAQAGVIGRALKESGISPRTISYIEAHGTGTSLGDPIEIAGLTKAFREYTRDNRFCAIGSVKSNIGHCESAAGMAGLTKVLLQLKHGCLVPSLHARELNPHIDFSSTPFVVQQELADWKPPRVKLDGETREYPRRAGISAFGAGGANAHLVIEEYIPEKLEPPSIAVTSRNPAIIVLSAKKAEQLREQVRRLLAFAAAADAEQQSGSTALMDMAYTLQVGREPMEERLAVMVGSLRELREKLEGFLEDREGIPGLYLGQVKRNKENIAIFTADEDLQKAMDAWISKGKYGKLLDLWVKGLIFDWDKLYSGSAPYKPRRIGLPTYPFARERCWVTGSAPVPGTAENFEIMTFEETWQEEALPDASMREIKTLVCFISHPENQQAIVESKPASAGSTGIIFIARGETFQKQSPQRYTVCRTDGDTYREAFKSIRADYGEVDAVLYLWPLEDPAFTRDYSCIVYILRAFASAKLKARRLLLAAPFENALDRCYLESWIGFERSSGLVLPHTQVAVILQAKSAGEQDREAVINDWMGKLGKELHTAKAQSVLYQEGKRQVCRIRPTTPQPGSTLIRPGGTYLIIGGSGGLGLIFARHFAGTQPVNLVLTGRSPLDAEKQSQIKALEASGSRVLYVQAEVCSETSLQQGVSLAKERFGRIHGVIHAAGIQGHDSILEKEPQSFQKVLDPKIKGTLVLDKVIGEEPLDFTCYFSSSSAILGDFGSCDYAVANRFQMAYALYRAEQQGRGQRRGKTIVINWPLWKDGGMGVDDDEKSKMYLESSGQRFLETEAGTALFDRLLAQTGTQHLVMVGQPARVHRFLGLVQDPASRSISGASPLSGRKEPAAMKEDSLEKCLERDFQGHIGKILKISPDKLAPDENLADFGFDSIGLAEFASSLTDYYEIEITPAVFFGYPTIEKLIQYFLSKHGEAMAAFYRGNEPGTAAPAAPGQPGSEKSGQAVNTDNRPIPGPLAPIAVIGMSGRFPGANTIEEFWQNLVQGKSCITGIPADRWDWREYDGDPHREKGKTNCRWGAFMDNIDCFDPLFFEISPKEAELMDPKQRLFLEEAWHALEDAGYMGQRIKGKSCGVYVGVEEGEYGFLAGENGQVNSNQNATLSARIAYTLDLSGPNLALTAACSSGLVAVHQACQALRQGECHMALVGGISLIISPLTYISMSKADMLSPQGKCYVFDRRANGLVPGEAAAVVLLKPLSRAAADNDHIYGVIKASGVNYDGKTNGLTAPNPLRQAELIQTIYDKYLINPANIQYAISHSTGSKLGDPVEIEAFTEAFKKYTDKKQYCTIGSMKPLIGHTFAASGLVSLISMLMAMKYRTIPGSHYFESANEYIHFQETPFMVNRENQAWPAADNRPGLGVIGTTGISGTNAHAVIEEYLPLGEKPLQLPSFTSPQVAVFSAKNPERLQAAARQMLDFLGHESAAGLHLPDIAYTLQIGREAMKERLAMVVSSKQELSQKLHAFTTLPPGDFGEHRVFTGSGETANPGSLESPASGKEDPEKLASLWVNGAAVPWEKLHEGQPVKIISLPTYPFKKRRCWPGAPPTAYPEEKYKIMPLPQDYENKAAELYDLKARDGDTEFKEEYLTFAPFNEKVPGFSMSGVFLYPGKYPGETRLTREKQIEMRQVLFCKEDFREIHTLVDIGCGHGTDVIQIAALYPHVHTYGYTITRAQADLGNQRIARMNLDSRAKIFHKDSSKDAFPGGCDLIIGFEVCCHIGDKHGLFRNMDSALNENGRVLLMDFVANLRGPIADPNIEISISTKQDWIDLLSQYHLVIDEIIDVSPQIANFAYDPYFEQNTKDIPRVMKDSLQNFTNCSMSLQKGWISYCLFRLRKDTGGSDRERRDENAHKISNPTPYPEALKDMLNRGHIPYPGKDHERDTRERGGLPPCRFSEQYTREQRGLPPCGFPDRPPDPGPIKADLQDIFINVLKLQPGELEETSTFKELGINSIDAVELLEAINSRFNLALPTSIIFECSKIDSLARYIREHLPETRAIQRTDAAPGPGTPFTHLQKNRRRESDDIAIIGLSCRCAGADNQEEFWDIVREGKDCIREIQNREWLDFFQSNSDKEIPARYGKMEDIEFFDPLFFNISPKEAAAMDPTQRILLEEIYKALEDSGYTPSGLNDQPVGTLIGAMGSAPMHRDFSHFSMLGTDTSILASRIAYFLDLKGPALAINTACSSSLVAIDMACRELKGRDIDLAIAGGVTIYTRPGAFIQMRNAGMLSPTGECRPFDQAANGIVVGDGVGVIILKRLAEARRDNDYIYGIIRGSGTNQDGQTAGITVPGFLSQSRLEESVYRKNQICVEDFQYIETHGTATKLGDPVEIHALDHCFKKFTSRKRFCGIGSLKANIGHTTAAAGVLGVIKVLLSLKHKQIPPSIHFDKENEHIDFANSAFFVNTSLSQWPANAKGSRLAAVSSFGFSGTNAHLVIEEYTDAPPETPARVNETAPGLLALSAQSRDGLLRYAKKTREFLRAHKGINLADFLYTFQVGREAMPFRLALAAANQEELIKQLEQFSQNHITKSTKVFTGKVEKKAGLHPGETEENREFIQELIRHGELEKLARLWVNGSRINWEALYPSGTVKRLAGLPTYPFTRERIGVRNNSAPVPIVSNRPGKPREISLLPLSGDQIPASQPAGQLRQSIRLSSTTISESPPDSSFIPGPATPAPTAVPVSALEEELKTSLAEALFLEPRNIHPDERFIDLGLDSIIGVEWTQAINTKYGTSLPATSIYDYPTLRDLAGFLANELNKQGGGSGIKKAGPSLTREKVQEISVKETPANPVSQTRAMASPGEAYRSPSGDDPEAIAIIGMSGRYPGASDLSQYWDNLAQAKNSIKEIPGSRWDVNRYYDPRPSQEGKIYCKWLGVLEDIEYFDPSFFKISPGEAALMDPQHRLFLLEGYKAFENAGYNSQSLSRKKCGVYLGIASSEYGLMLQQNQAGMADPTGNSFAIAAARISYHLDLKGPAIPIDTACSSSLVATHLACQALLNGEIDMALVGGVSLYLTPESYISMCRAGMLSPDGQCKTFDNHANGFVPGEGVGTLVLKRLKDAQAHGDSIYGVIIGSGINHDGKTNGITAPSVNSQIELEREIYHKYKIDPAGIGYVETHGTGTKLGDPVELRALSTVFKERTSKKNYCALASVKTNIGHTSAAAGIAAVQKVLLSLRHKQLAPTLNVKTYNEYFNFEDSPFYVNTRLQPWNPEPGFPRRAAVSAFGFSGTNAHMVIEEPHGENYKFQNTNYKQKTSFSLPGAKSRERSADNMIIFLLSAKSEPQLKTYAERMKGYIESDEDLDMENLAYTLQVGRAAMDHRLALAADSRETLVNALGEFINGNSSPGDLIAPGKTGNDEMKHFEEKKDTKALIQSLMRMKKPKELARLWLKGWNVDWTRLYDGGSPHQPRRISLPTYPFARERCWVPGTAAAAGSAAANPVPAANLHPAPRQHKRETSNPPPLQTPTKSNALADKIQKYLTDKLGKIADVNSTFTDLEVNLMDLGLKSSRLVQLTNEIQKETNIELNPTLFFEYPNIKALTEFFSREHQDPFMQLLGNSSTPPGDSGAGLQTPPPVNTNGSGENTGGDIAVIGMSGLFAGSPDLDKFWIHLRDQSDLIKEIPMDHWDYRPWYEKNPEAPDKTYCKWGSFIEDVDKFDAEFFNISPREAEWMDPQLRLLLQSVYAAGEDAGYINRLRGTAAGVFVGVCLHDYADRITALNLPMNPYLGTGNTQTVIANRVSFYFDFTGPSIAIDTACSSSLFALHYACQALRGKECAAAFVSGVNLLLSPVHYRYFSSLGALSPTGRCHTFDEAADGYVPGEGIATILLKPLEQAKRDGDRIHAVIKGSAALHGGYTPSLTAPGVAGEENVILKAWENAGIHPETLSYLEAHGTGTKLGDPIEVTALKKAFKRYTDKERFCAMGSAKSNIGHTEGAAGIAGVLKVILQMKHRQIPALPQFKKLNPHIQLEKSALYLPRELAEWKSPAGVPRRAGVNSFGFSGAYAHVVLEEYIPGEPERPPITIDTRGPAIIVLSAKNEERLKEQVQRLLSFITTPGRQFSDTYLMDMAYTLQVGRETMEERLTVTVASIEELREKLNAFLEGDENCRDLYRGQVKRNKEALAVFAADEDLQQAIDNWLSKRKYAKLLDLWVKGLTIDWNQLYGDGKTNPYRPRRIGLPTYPFAGKRYWLAALETETGLTANGPAVPVSSTRSPFAFPAESAAPSTFASPSAKPSGIPLQSLSDGPIPPPSPPPPGTGLSPANPSLSITPAGADPGAASPDHVPAHTRVEVLREELKTSLAKVLYINRSEVVLDKKFIEMGLDSIVCVEWVKDINKQYGTGIAATSVYDYPTLGEFAGFLAKELKVSMTTPKPSPVPVPSLQEELSLSLGRVLSMDQGDIDADDEFVEMGLDAVLGMEWLQAINQQYGTSITAAGIHDYPTLRQFAGFLEKELNQERGDFTTSSLKTTPSLSLDELIDQVQQGALDCRQADRLFDQL